MSPSYVNNLTICEPYLPYAKEIKVGGYTRWNSTSIDSSADSFSQKRPHLRISRFLSTFLLASLRSGSLQSLKSLSVTCFYSLDNLFKSLHFLSGFASFRFCEVGRYHDREKNGRLDLQRNTDTPVRGCLRDGLKHQFLALSIYLLSSSLCVLLLWIYLLGRWSGLVLVSSTASTYSRHAR